MLRIERALERRHATLKTMERKTGQGVTEWDRLLGSLLFAYRDSVHEATGFTPFQLLFGRTVRGQLELVSRGKEIGIGVCVCVCVCE